MKVVSSASSSSLSNKENQLYESDAKGAACLLLQREVISVQAVSVEKYLREGILLQEKHLQVPFDCSELGEVLSNRMADAEETKSAKGVDDSSSKKKERVMDDIEVTIMGILDSDGKITVKTRLAEFMSLMSRIEKVDHRALCLHILQKNMSSACEHAFVQEGGLRLLKQWIKTSKEQKCINELKSICKLLKKLPYYSEQLSSCGFSQTLKSLKVWEDGMFEKHVNAILEAWRAKAKEEDKGGKSGRNNSAAAVPLTVDQKNMTAAMREKMVKERGDQEEARAPSPSESSASTAVAKTVASKPIGMKVVTMAGASSTPIDPKVSPTAKSVGLNVVKPTAKAASTSETSAAPGNGTTAAVAAAQEKVTPPAVPMAILTRTVPRAASKKVDIGAIARAAADDADRKAKEEATEARANAPKPGKGGLKRSYGDVSGAANGNGGGPDNQKARKVKRNIRWADAEGGALKDVRTFYVEGLKASTAKHKDAAAREKQLEKESRKAHKKDSMQKKCAWAKPEKLGWLGDVEQVQEQALESFESKEVEVIKSRLEVTPDASYPDVTLIPNDPEEPDRSCPELSVKGGPTKSVDIIFNSGPVGGLNPWGAAAAVDDFHPLGATDGRPSPAILACVPEQLHFIGGPVLEVLAKEPTQIAALLNFDGSPNMSMINAFRSHILGPTAPPMAPPPAPVGATRQSRFSNANNAPTPYAGPGPPAAQRYR